MSIDTSNAAEGSKCYVNKEGFGKSIGESTVVFVELTKDEKVFCHSDDGSIVFAPSLVKFQIDIFVNVWKTWEEVK